MNARAMQILGTADVQVVARALSFEHCECTALSDAHERVLGHLLYPPFSLCCALAMRAGRTERLNILPPK
jgi:hypothetical protein